MVPGGPQNAILLPREGGGNLVEQRLLRDSPPPSEYEKIVKNTIVYDGGGYRRLL